MHRVTKGLLASVVACATAAVGSFGIAPQHAFAAGAACNPSVSVDGDYSVLTFQATGSCTWTPPAGLSLVDVLVVGAGGGGGGGKQPSLQPRAAGGGGGGGHVTTATSVTVSAPVTVVVGAGGAGGAQSRSDHFDNYPGADGGTSSFGVQTAPGGVGGGGVVFPDETRWSGDGGNSGRSIGGIHTTTTGGSSHWDAAGGGAGSGANGNAGTDLPGDGGIGGDGGAGVTSSITGSSVIYGGGGGGGGAWDGAGSASTDGSGGVGGTGGGGAGSQLPNVPATAGIDGRGGGGGGGGYTDNNASSAGATGGDGIVVVRYLTTARNLVVTTAPGNTTVGGALTAPVVQVQDGNGNAVALSGVTVSAFMTTGSGTLSNALAVTNAAGSATFPGFGLSGAAGNYVVEFRANLLTAVTTPIRIDPPFEPPSPPDTGGGSAQPPETPQPTGPSSNAQVNGQSAAPQPPLTPLSPGTSSAVIGGTPVVVREEPVERGRVLVVTAGPVEMSLRGTAPSGEDIPLAPDGSLLLARSGDLPMSVSGLAPGSAVTMTLFSDPINLGVGTVDGAGNYSSTVSIPANVPLGTHTLRIQGTANTNDSFTLDVGVTAATPVVALGANPKLTVRPYKLKKPSTLHVLIQAAQRGCMVTFKTGNATAKARVSKEGRAAVTITSQRALKKIQRVTARISGKGCAPVTVSR